MNCASIDLKAFFLDESSGAERRAVEQHLVSCAACREELDRLGVTQSALLTVRDEEIPRRIAFVSDKVFQPRWYERLWNSGPRLGFVSAMMLACAILVHAFYTPAGPAVPATAPVTVAASVSDAEIEARVEAAVNARLDAAVAKAVSEVRAGQDELIARKVAEAVEPLEQDLAAVGSAYHQITNKWGQLVKNIPYADASFGGPQ